MNKRNLIILLVSMIAAFFTVMFLRVKSPADMASKVLEGTYAGGTLGEKNDRLMDAPELPGMKELRNAFNDDGGLLKMCFKKEITQAQLDSVEKDFYKDHEAEVKKWVALYQKTPAQELTCDLQFPALIEGCEGENCRSFSLLRARDHANVVDSPLTRNVIGKIEKGFETREVLEFKILVKEQGRMRALDSIEGEGLSKVIRMGYRFSTLAFLGEGFMTGCIGNQLFTWENENSAEMSKAELTEDWVKIRLNGTTAGFVPYGTFENVGNDNDGD